MRSIEEIEESFKSVRSKCIKSNGSTLAENRLHFSYVLSELSEWIATLEAAVSKAKNEREKLFLQHKAGGSSIAEAKSKAEVEIFEDLWSAELEFTKVKRLIASGSEILNAVSSKLRWEEKEFNLQE